MAMTWKRLLGLAVALGLAGCSLRVPGGFPLGGARDSPPPGLAEKALPLGAAAPDFTLPDAHGQPIQLSALLRQGPVVALFYRGRW